MPPTRSGADTERTPGGFVMSPGVLYDADGNPIGWGGGDDDVPTTPSRPGRRPGRISRALRNLGNRLLGN